MLPRWMPSPLAADADGNTVVLLALTLILMALLLVAALASLRIVRPWLQSVTAGCPTTAVHILGMKLRGVDADQVIRCGIMSTQAECPVAWDELERAALEGVDLEKVTLAYVEARRGGKPISFEELAAAERSDRLREMLDEA